MMVLTLCGALWGAAASAFADTRIGTVLGVPLAELDSFRRANTTTGSGFYGETVPPNSVSVLHVSSLAGAPINGAVATVSINRVDTGDKAWRVYFPRREDGTISPLYQYINAGDAFTNPRSLITGAGAVIQMDVRQESAGDFFIDGVRFLLLPESFWSNLEIENPNASFTIVHRQLMTSNFGAFWVQLVAIDAEHARELKVPKGMESTVEMLNSNLTIGYGNLAQVR
jgi:hypothetical protein